MRRNGAGTRLGAKAAAKVGLRGGGKLLPVIGEALMAYDAGSETYRLVKERRRGKKRGLGESAARVAGAAFISGEGVDWVQEKLRRNTVLEHPFSRRAELPKGWWGPAFYSTLVEGRVFRSHAEAMAAEDVFLEEDRQRRAAERGRSAEGRTPALEKLRSEESDRQRALQELDLKRALEAAEEAVSAFEALVALEERRLRKWDAEGGPKTSEDRKNYALFRASKEKEQEGLRAARKALSDLRRSNPRRCSRCKGTGRVAGFAHVEGGLCFACQGSGRA